MKRKPVTNHIFKGRGKIGEEKRTSQEKHRVKTFFLTFI